MRIEECLWLETIIEKLSQKHKVTPEEVEEVLFNDEKPPHIRFAERGERAGEGVYAAYGRTDAGRYLIIFFIYKPMGEALILSARDMNERERKLYESR